jgi:hypothetical protein
MTVRENATNRIIPKTSKFGCIPYRNFGNHYSEVHPTVHNGRKKMTDGFRCKSTLQVYAGTFRLSAVWYGKLNRNSFINNADDTQSLTMFYSHNHWLAPCTFLKTAGAKYENGLCCRQGWDVKLSGNDGWSIAVGSYTFHSLAHAPVQFPVADGSGCGNLAHNMHISYATYAEYSYCIICRANSNNSQTRENLEPRVAFHAFLSERKQTVSGVRTASIWRKPRPIFFMDVRPWPHSDMHAHLGCYFFEPKDIQSISLGAIWSFSNASGLPWLDMGYKWPGYKA